MADGPSRRTVLRAMAVGTVLAVAGCAPSAPPRVDRLRLATGPAGAVYREFGAALAELWNAAWGAQVVTVVPTDASVDNVHLLLDGEVELGLVNVDVAHPHREELRALLRVFDSVVHLLVPEDSPVGSLADLAGLRVSVGLPGSGTRFVADRLLSAAGVAVLPSELGQADAAEALYQGRVDAVLSLTAMPTPAISWLLQQPRARFRFVDLSADGRELHRRHPGEYLDVTITGTVYPEVAAAATLAVPTLLAARADLAEEIAAFCTRSTVLGAAELSRSRPEARQINRRTAVATTPIRLHPGAADWFRSVKP